MATRVLGRLSAALVIVAPCVLVLACGGGGGGGGSDSSSDGDPQRVYTVEEVEAAAVSRLGNDGAAVALAFAMDKGFSPGQIGEAAVNGRLSASGDITDSAGNAVEGKYAPSHLFERTTRDLAARTGLDQLINVANQQSSTLGETAFVFFFLCGVDGYTPDQIAEALLSGHIQIAQFPDEDEPVFELYDADGQRIYPGRQRDSSINTTTARQSLGSSTAECPNGTFNCGSGQVICAELACNRTANCSDASDEAPSLCGNPDSCCVATRGCPGETGSHCASGCCCCPTAQACDQNNWQNGCVAAAMRQVLDFDELMRGLPKQ